MKPHKNIKLYLLGILAILVSALLISSPKCSAGQITFSPMRQFKILIPGTTDDLTLTIASPADAKESTKYELDVRPFRVDDNNNTYFEADGEHSQIIDWIEMPKESSGYLEPNEHKEVVFKVTVPKDAPAGGQYVAIVIKTDDGNDSGVKQVFEFTHPIYVEVAGETIRQGEVTSMTVPSFLFSGNLTAGASVKNLGNVHSNVKHTLKVYPLIGSEEFYTNEEDPQENLIMPGTTRYSSTEWEQTPTAGIFRVKYTVEFEGVKNELEKIVIVCPLWLLIVIVLFIVVVIYHFVTGSKRKKSSKETEA